MPPPRLLAPPFRTGEIVSDEYFTDRADEVAAVRKAMLGAGRLLLVGERRQGKSSIIRQAALHARAQGAVIATVDLWTATRLEEVLRRIVAGVPWEWSWRERLQTLWVGLGLNLGIRADAGGSPALTLDVRPGMLGLDRTRELLLQLLARLDTVAGESGQPVALVLDEFQRMEEMEEGASALLRSAIQESHALSFVCAGSAVSLVDSLVGPEGPLHGVFQELTIGAIDPVLLGGWIEGRMHTAGVTPTPGTGAEIISWAGPRTEDVLRLAREVWDNGQSSGNTHPDDVRAAMRRLVLDRRAGYQRLWVELADSHRSVLRAMASGEIHLTSRETIRRFALPTPAAVLKAVGRLRERGLLDAAGEAIADPFLREWVLMDAMPDGVSRSGTDTSPDR